MIETINGKRIHRAISADGTGITAHVNGHVTMNTAPKLFIETVIEFALDLGATGIRLKIIAS